MSIFGSTNNVTGFVTNGNFSRDYAIGTQTHPFVFIPSGNAVSNQYGSFQYDGTDFNIGSTGGLNLSSTRTKISGMFSYGPAGSLTIATGVVAVTGPYHTLVVEGGTGAGADALTSATGGEDGDLLVLKTSTSGANDTVTITNGTGAGAFILANATNFVMDHVDDRIEFIHNGTEWVEKFRSDNS